MQKVKDLLRDLDIYMVTGLLLLVIQAIFFIVAVGYLLKSEPIHSVASVALGAYTTYVLTWWGNRE